MNHFPIQGTHTLEQSYLDMVRHLDLTSAGHHDGRKHIGRLGSYVRLATLLGNINFVAIPDPLCEPTLGRVLFERTCALYLLIIEAKESRAYAGGRSKVHRHWQLWKR
jgi:hypothetical protein